MSLEPCRAASIDAVLVPGLVNAHSHLDLGGHAPLPATGDFTGWLLGIGATRQAARDVAERAEREARQLLRSGATAVGDVDGTGGEGARGRRRSTLRGVSYLEVVGVRRDDARSRLARMLEAIDRLGAGTGDLGLSPHAPYSVHADVLPEIARAASRRGLPLAMHLAETEEETRYLLHGDGPFARFLEVIGRGAPFERPPGLRPIAYAEAAGLLEAGCVVVHGNDLDDDDIGILARHAASVVYCHGTHRHFDRPAHRLGDLLTAGVNVALGTDSGLSNRGVDLFAELRRLARERSDLPPVALLAAATTGGRRALRLDPGAACFAPGSTADALLVGPAPNQAEQLGAQGLLQWLLHGEDPVLASWHHGEPVTPLDAADGRTSGLLDTLRAQG